ncbi:MAG: IS5 family transposase [Candidatus Korobacteraceae bacterium]
MARIAEALRSLARRLHPHESLVQEWRAQSSFRVVAARADRAHQDRRRQDGLYHREGASGWHRGSKKSGPQAIGKFRGGWSTKIHMVAADARTAITFALSPGQASDAKAGRDLLGGLGPLPAPLYLLMDRAYEDNETRQLALDFGFIPLVPTKSNRLEPWQYDKAMYRKRNEIERLFRRLKGFRRIFSRFEKLDVLFLGFLTFALIAEALQIVLTRPSSVLPLSWLSPGTTT